MLQALILAHLKAQLTGVNIKGAATLSAVQSAKPVLPAVFIVMTHEQGVNTRYLSGQIAQKRAANFTVITAVTNLRDAIGEAASTDLVTLRKQVDAALFGWSPDGTTLAPIIFNNGNSAGFIDQELWWQDHYTTEFDRR